MSIARRDFLATLGSMAVALPFGARAQQIGKIRRIGVLMAIAAEDSEAQDRMQAFAERLAQLGWTAGQNVQIDYRWAAGSADAIRKYAEELVGLAPDVILVHSSAATAPLLQATHTIPIVFTVVADPVGAGYVESLAHPGGNATGFTNFEYAIGGKWLELLKELAPSVIRAAVVRESATAAGPGQFGAIQAVAPSFRMELRPIDVRDDPAEIERAIAAFAKGPAGGLIVTGSSAAAIHRELIIKLAAKHQLPAVYNSRFYVTSGGLISYGPNFVDQYRSAAVYVDAILRGAKTADLPVQASTKYELVINMKTARALGLHIPATVLARADEVIE